MKWLIFIVVLIILPLFCKLEGNYINQYKTLYINVKLFGFVVVLKCKIVWQDNRLTLIIFNKFKKQLKFIELFDFKNNVKPFLDFHFLKISLYIQLGNENTYFPLIITGYFSKIILDIICDATSYYKPYLTIYNNVDILDENVFDIHVTINAVFNLLIVCINLIKMLWERICNAKFNKHNKRNNTRYA